MLVNPETMKVEKKLDVSGNFTATDVSLIGESIVIWLKDRITAIAITLEQSEVASLPITITEKMRTGNLNTMPKVILMFSLGVTTYLVID